MYIFPKRLLFPFQYVYYNVVRIPIFEVIYIPDDESKINNNSNKIMFILELFYVLCGILIKKFTFNANLSLQIFL